jgi:hypothetical protein
VTFLVPRGPFDLLAGYQRGPIQKGFLAPQPHLRKSQKKANSGWNDLFGRESSRQPVIPPAPLTGDAGRGCGDASRAPNFLAENLRHFWTAPLLAPPSGRLGPDSKGNRRLGDLEKTEAGLGKPPAILGLFGLTQAVFGVFALTMIYGSGVIATRYAFHIELWLRSERKGSPLF